VNRNIYCVSFDKVVASVCLLVCAVKLVVFCFTVHELNYVEKEF
jgi:hypothetical protein